MREYYQTEVSECGLACIATAASMLGSDLTLNQLRGRHGSSRGANVIQMIEVLSGLDIHARAVRCEIEELKHITCPAILHWNMNHYVVLLGHARGTLKIFDPAIGVTNVSRQRVERSFTGVALELSKMESFKARPVTPTFNARQVLTLSSAARSALLHGSVYSVFLQVFMLASPFFMQIAIDEAAARGDIDVLGILVAGFLALVVLNSIAEWLRGVAVGRATAMIGFDASRRLFRHLVSLPLPWFERRRLADVATRMEVLDTLKNAFATGLAASTIDGILTITLVAAMFLYSPLLCGISLLLLIGYVVARMILAPFVASAVAASMQSSMMEKGSRLETVKSIGTLKSGGGERGREVEWISKLSDSTTRSLRAQKYQFAGGALRSLFDGLANAAVIYFAVQSIVDARMSIGAAYAFMAFRRNLFMRVHTLVEGILTLRVSWAHCDRLADIALSEVESQGSPSMLAKSSHLSRLSSKGVYYRYGGGESYALSNVDIELKQGEFIAIVGRTGSGKTTLLKTLAGLYAPTLGQVEMDGFSPNQMGWRVFRSNLGIVLQEDELLAGSILDNVTFFAERIDKALVWKCLEIAAVRDEVEQMPMLLDTRVGDISGTLSTGQKQRILLARALYKEPKFLLLDEFTSNVDPRTERCILANLEELGIGRLIVTHRKEVLACAQRVYEIRGGQLIRVKLDDKPLTNVKEIAT